MKTITLLNEKGGVGKTTLATHIATGLAIRGHRVILADTDMQAHATVALGLPPGPGMYTLMVRPDVQVQDVLHGIPADRYVVPDEAPDIKGALYMVPSNQETRNIPNSMSDVSAFQQKFAPLKDAVDFLIVDTSPTANLFHTAVYIATDAILYPTRLEEWSFLGLNSAIQRREQANKVRIAYNMDPIEMLGIIPMMTRMKTVLHQINYEKLQEAFGDLVLEPIASRTAWAEAANAYLPIFAFDPASRAAQDAWRIVDLVEATIHAK